MACQGKGKDKKEQWDGTTKKHDSLLLMKDSISATSASFTVCWSVLGPVAGEGMATCEPTLIYTWKNRTAPPRLWLMPEIERDFSHAKNHLAGQGCDGYEGKVIRGDRAGF
jgi:hypothetical protein